MDTKGISKLDLKRRNRRQILLAIRNAGMLARVDIAAQLSLTRAAVTIITNQMISQGILEDMNTPAPAPDMPRKKGRRKTMIRINPNYKFVLGAVVDEDFVNVGLSNLADDVLGKSKMTITAETGQKEIISFIVKSCRDMIRKASLKPDQVLGLGIGIVQNRWKNLGVEVTEKGAVLFDSVQEQVSRELGMPVFCGNAVGLYAVANTDFTDQRHRCQLLLYSVSGYQTAVVRDGELVGGIATDSASVDRIILTPGGRKSPGYPDGSVHAEISVSALEEQSKEALGRDVTIEEMCSAYIKEDPEAVRITNEALDKLAVLIYNLCACHHASRVVYHSYLITKPAMKRLQQLVSDICGERQEIKLERSKVEGDKSFLAGSQLAMARLFYDLGGMNPNADANES